MTIATFALAALVSSQAPSPQAESLTRGSVVLLANKTDAQSSDAIRRALTNPDPLVRRVAARVTAVAHSEAFETLRDALPNEKDPAVVAEFVKDIMVLAGAKALPLVDRPARQAGNAAVVAIAEWYARMEPQGFASHLRSWAEMPRIEPELGSIVSLAVACHPEARDEILMVWHEVVSSDKATSRDKKGDTAEQGTVIQTPEGLATRVLTDTLDASGCRTRSGLIGAVMMFTPDGRPRTIEVMNQPITGECRTALAATARISTADPEDPGQRVHELVIPLSKDFLACSASSPDPPVHHYFPSEGWRSPRLIKEVKPNYTSEAMKAKIEGTAEFVAVVTLPGCVSHARLTRSLKGLDFQALDAILQWRFAPAEFGGRAVATEVLIELSFTLRG